MADKGDDDSSIIGRAAKQEILRDSALDLANSLDRKTLTKEILQDQRNLLNEAKSRAKKRDAILGEGLDVKDDKRTR